MARRRYTHDQRAAAVADAEVNGAEHAAETSGIPRTTILYWLDKPEFVELRQKTREQQRDGYRVLIQKAQERLVAAIPTMEPRDVTILLGVSQDKDLLLSGDATARSETRNLASGLDDHERAALKRVLVDELARRQDRDGDPGAGVDAATAPDSA
jgi:transposase-like protein